MGNAERAERFNVHPSLQRKVDLWADVGTVQIREGDVKEYLDKLEVFKSTEADATFPGRLGVPAVTVSEL